MQQISNPTHSLRFLQSNTFLKVHPKILFTPSSLGPLIDLYNIIPINCYMMRVIHTTNLMVQRLKESSLQTLIKYSNISGQTTV